MIEEPAPPEEILSVEQEPLLPAEQEPSTAEEPFVAEQELQEPVAQYVAPSEPKRPGMELLSSFALMETRPFLPPEVGRAVIFEARKPDVSVRL